MAAQACAAAAGRGGVEGVEQLAEGYGRRPRLTRRLVGAGVGDHEVLGRRDDRVEHQLAVLAARVALAGDGPAGEHVVTVDRPGAREDAVVEAEQAHHAVRHRPHRHQRRDGQRAGAEVGPGGPAGEALAHQRADVGQPQLEARRRRVAVDHGRQLALHLAGLPLVAPRDGGELRRRRRRSPPASAPPGGCRSRPSVTALEPVEALGEPAGEVDAGAADVVERERRAEEPVGVVADRHPGEHPVEAEAPGVLHVALQAERLAVLPRRRPSGCRRFSTQPVIVSRSESVNPKRRRTGPAASRSSTRLASARPPARSSSWPTTASSGLVWVSERSASRTRSWWPGCRRRPSPMPKAAATSGA